MNEDRAPGGIESRGELPAKRYRPAVDSFITALFHPGRTARRACDVRLATAFLIHVSSAVLTFFAVLVLIAWEEQSSYSLPAAILIQAIEFFDEIAREFMRYPLITSLATLGIIALVEVSFALLAILVAAWGAHDEKLRSSFYHSLKLTWLHSARAPIIVLCCGVILLNFFRIDAQKRQGYYPSWPISPTAPTGNDPKAMKDYKDAMALYQKEFAEAVEQQQMSWDNYRRSLPWYVRHSETIAFLFVWAFVVWVFWSLLRMVGARPPPMPVARPPTCEWCGYDLTGTANDGRCPECGRAVRDSLGVHVRAGAPWQCRNKSGLIVSWIACAWQGFNRPSTIGRNLRTRRSTRDHRRFLLGFVPIMATVCFAGVIACSLADNSFAFNQAYDDVVFWGVGPVSAGIGCSFVFLLPLGTAVVAAVWLRIRTGRNLLSASIQVAAYAAGYVVLIALVLFSCLCVVITLEGAFREWGRVFRIDDDILVFGALATPVAMCLFLYLVQVVRGSAAARYANR
ncbi:MAG: hypothetical protein O7B26_03115 [Planctomycetota bacterium]|nr:hypothetical protein [Planctomycetota bacterium]